MEGPSKESEREGAEQAAGAAQSRTRRRVGAIWARYCFSAGAGARSLVAGSLSRTS